MTVVLIIVSVIVAWMLVSLALAFFLGRAMKVAKQREAARVGFEATALSMSRAQAQHADLIV